MKDILHVPLCLCLCVCVFVNEGRYIVCMQARELSDRACAGACAGVCVCVCVVFGEAVFQCVTAWTVDECCIDL